MASTVAKPLAILASSAFQPYITAPLLLLLLRGPDSIRIPLLKQLHGQGARLITTLKYLVAIGALSRVNKFLSAASQNNWYLTNGADEWDWSKEVVLITGGSSGFGALVVQELSKKGITVVVMDVQDLQYECPPKVHFYKVDITSASAVASTAATIRSAHGNPTVLINNAGIGTNATILDSTPEYLDKIFNVNIISHFHLVKEFLPSMIANDHGHVITIASMASFVTVAGIVSYCCTKSAALAFHEGLGQELRYRYKAPKVKTSVVHSSWARTPLVGTFEDSLDNAGAKMMDPKVVSDAIVKQVLEGRSGQLIIPAILTGATGIRGWANWLQERVRNGTSKAILEEIDKREAGEKVKA